jgi:hypothetical protein
MSGPIEYTSDAEPRVSIWRAASGAVGFQLVFAGQPSEELVDDAIAYARRLADAFPIEEAKA